MREISSTWGEIAHFYFVENIFRTSITILLIAAVFIFLIFIVPRLDTDKKNDGKLPEIDKTIRDRDYLHQIREIRRVAVIHHADGLKFAKLSDYDNALASFNKALAIYQELPHEAQLADVENVRREIANISSLVKEYAHI